jgi:HTH-type transcriptional regulator / antitoxin HipB
MTDIEKFIEQRKKRNPQAWANFEKKYENYYVGSLLSDIREKAGVSLSLLSRRSNIHQTALSRLENHGEDVRLSTLTRYAAATRRPILLKITPNGGWKIGSGKMAALVEISEAKTRPRIARSINPARRKETVSAR